MTRRGGPGVALWLAAALLAAWGAAARADYLKVQRHAVVHALPASQSDTVTEVEPGAVLGLLEDAQTNGYYRASGAVGEGWVYRTFVRRFAGNPPGAPAPAPSSAAAAGGNWSAYSTGVFKQCPQRGKPKNPAQPRWDPDLNTLKNRDLPPPLYADKTIADFLTDEPESVMDMGKANRANWSEEARSEAAEMEFQGVRIEGFLRRVDKEGPESCNCYSSDHVDHHLWLGETPSATIRQCMVVEVSPRLLPQHPGWVKARLDTLVDQHERVRISGWAMWDQEHPEKLGVTRGTLWEVHPVHQIEVFRNGGWKPFEN